MTGLETDEIETRKSNAAIMKVVLFCGGLGTRLRDYSDSIPKPLVPIGSKPILWHIMKYYAHFGHKDFILCLGYMGDKIKNYFLSHNPYLANDFTMRSGGKDLELMCNDLQDWNVTFVDTGLSENVGQRLKRVEKYLEGEEMFLASYSDGLTDIHLPAMVEEFEKSGKVVSFICAPPSQTFHVVTLGEKNRVGRIEYVRDSGLLVNCGFFVLRRQIFDYIQPGEDLVVQPFQRLISKDLLMGHKCERFWAMDTFKEQQELSDLCSKGDAPWEVWKKR